jgi:hypothetical protein
MIQMLLQIRGVLLQIQLGLSLISSIHKLGEEM